MVFFSPLIFPVAGHQPAITARTHCGRNPSETPAPANSLYFHRRHFDVDITCGQRGPEIFETYRWIIGGVTVAFARGDPQNTRKARVHRRRRMKREGNVTDIAARATYQDRLPAVAASLPAHFFGTSGQLVQNSTPVVPERHFPRPAVSRRTINPASLIV